jgi:hypothetical protein
MGMSQQQRISSYEAETSDYHGINIYPLVGAIICLGSIFASTMLLVWLWNTAASS